MSEKKRTAPLLTPLIAQLYSELSYAYGRIELMCDGRRISLEVQPVGSLRYKVVMYIDGWWRGEWSQPEPARPEHKFMRKEVHWLYSAAKRKRLEKSLGKRYAKELGIHANFTLFTNVWPSGKSAISHLNKVCERIEVLLPKATTETDAGATT